jgi:hypothetical protein
MAINQLLRLTGTRGATPIYQINNDGGKNFVKNTFDFGQANPCQPEGRVYDNALGDPTKGVNLYCLG